MPRTKIRVGPWRRAYRCDQCDAEVTHREAVGIVCPSCGRMNRGRWATTVSCRDLVEIDLNVPWWHWRSGEVSRSVELHPEALEARRLREESEKRKRQEREEMQAFNRMLIAERTRRMRARIPKDDWDVFVIPDEWRHMEVPFLSSELGTCDRIFGLSIVWDHESLAGREETLPQEEEKTDGSGKGPASWVESKLSARWQLLWDQEQKS